MSNLLLDKGGRFKKQVLFNTFNSTLSSAIRATDVESGYDSALSTASAVIRNTPVRLAVGPGGVALNPGLDERLNLAGVDPEQRDAVNKLIYSQQTLRSFLAKVGISSSNRSNPSYATRPFAHVYANTSEAITGYEYVLRYLDSIGLKYEFISSRQAGATPTNLSGTADMSAWGLGWDPRSVSYDRVSVMVPVTRTVNGVSEPFIEVFIRCPALNFFGIKKLVFGGGTAGIANPDVYNSYLDAVFGLQSFFVYADHEALWGERPFITSQTTATTIFNRNSIFAFSKAANEYPASNFPRNLLSDQSDKYIGGPFDLNVREADCYIFTLPPGVDSISFLGDYKVSGRLEDDDLYLEISDQSILGLRVSGNTLLSLYDTQDEASLDRPISAEERAQLANHSVLSYLLPRNLGIPYARMGDLTLEKEARKNDMSLEDELYRTADNTKGVSDLTFGEAFDVVIKAKDTRWVHFFVGSSAFQTVAHGVEVTGGIIDPIVAYYLDGVLQFTEQASAFSDAQITYLMNAYRDNAVPVDRSNEGFASLDQAWETILGVPLSSLNRDVASEGGRHFDESFQRYHYIRRAPFHSSVRAATCLSQVINSREYYTEMAGGSMAYWSICSARLLRYDGVSGAGTYNTVSGREVYADEAYDTGNIATGGGVSDSETGVIDNPNGAQIGDVPLSLKEYFQNLYTSVTTPNQSLETGYAYTPSVIGTTDVMALAGSIGDGSLRFIPVYQVNWSNSATGLPNLPASSTPGAYSVNTQIPFAVLIDMVKKGWRNLGSSVATASYKQDVLDLILEQNPHDFVDNDPRSLPTRLREDYDVLGFKPGLTVVSTDAPEINVAYDSANNKYTLRTVTTDLVSLINGFGSVVVNLDGTVTEPSLGGLSSFDTFLANLRATGSTIEIEDYDFNGDLTLYEYSAWLSLNDAVLNSFVMRQTDLMLELPQNAFDAYNS